jgi:hypothetical protein
MSRVSTFLEALTGPERLPATNDGHMPRQLANLIAFLIFGVAADAQAVCERRWFGVTRAMRRRRSARPRIGLWIKIRRLVRRPRSG